MIHGMVGSISALKGRVGIYSPGKGVIMEPQKRGRREAEEMKGRQRRGDRREDTRGEEMLQRMRDGMSDR